MNITHKMYSLPNSKQRHRIILIEYEDDYDNKCYEIHDLGIVNKTRCVVKIDSSYEETIIGQTPAEVKSNCITYIEEILRSSIGRRINGIKFVIGQRCGRLDFDEDFSIYISAHNTNTLKHKIEALLNIIRN